MNDVKRLGRRLSLTLTVSGLLLLLLVLLVEMATATSGSPAESLSQESTVTLSLVATGLERPVAVAAPPGDPQRLFVVEKPGRIRVVNLISNTLVPTPFLDITNTVRSDGNEGGLLSVAFHPDFAANRYLFVNYTGYTGPWGDSYVVRYQASEDLSRADPLSAMVVLTLTQPYANHNGGQLQFGPDGYLYIGFGDGGNFGDPLDAAQDPTTWLGKILRIDVDGDLPYTVPPDNPFVGDPTGRDEIWSLGLRNPWRFSFDRQSGDLWIGDVGQNLWEEVDLEPAGSPGGINWGWNCYEGTHPYADPHPPPVSCPPVSQLTMPVHEYSHSDGCSVTGGYVYRGSSTAVLFGHYLFADYCRPGELRSLELSGTTWLRTDHTLVAPAGTSLEGPTSFGEDAAGNLYLADDSLFGTPGEVFLLELASQVCLPGNYDVNDDGRIDVLDVRAVAGDWQHPNFTANHDVDCSGAVDIVDVQLVAGALQNGG